MVADIEARRSDQRPEQKRDSPAPGLQIGGRHPQGKTDAERRREQIGQALAGKLPTCDKSAPLRRMLHQERGRAAEFAAGGKSLHQPRDENRYRRRNADAPIGRHQRDHESAERHQQDRNHQRGLAAVAVGIDAKDHATQWTREERQRECAQRQQQRNGGIAVREESLRDIDREISVDGDIVPFERVAD